MFPEQQEVEVERRSTVQVKVEMKMIISKLDKVKRLLLLQHGTQVPEEEDRRVYRNASKQHSPNRTRNRERLLLQAERGFAKEASVYFPYLDFVLFRTVHYATLPFCHSAIPPFCHSTIPSFCHSVIPPFCHSAILPFSHYAILLQYAIT